MEKEITGEMLLSRNIREIPTLLDPLLPKSGLVCLAGSSDTGKSAFLRQCCKTEHGYETQSTIIERSSICV